MLFNYIIKDQKSSYIGHTTKYLFAYSKSYRLKTPRIEEIWQFGKFLILAKSSLMRRI